MNKLNFLPFKKEDKDNTVKENLNPFQFAVPPLPEEKITSLNLDSSLPPSNKNKRNKINPLILGGIFLFLLFSLGGGVYFIKTQREEIRTKAGTGSECFYPPEIYRPAPYQYRVGDTSSPGYEDWVIYPIKPECANVERLSQIFGPLDKVFPDKEVYITRPNQACQYGFTFNRIMHIDGYSDEEVQKGLPEFSEQELHDLHYQGKDVQSIQDCDKNGRQVVFDLTTNNVYGKMVAKPNGWIAWEPGYYQFDLTPCFRCEGGAVHQQSLGAGFIRVVEGEGISCNQVSIYNQSWQKLDANQLSLLRAGDQVYLAVLGLGSGIDKARFRINGGNWIETEQKRTETEEFYISYVIPQGIIDFNIEAEVHHPFYGWK
ncbi:MAG: hypothetical protein ACPLKP_03720 [Microgenomates group bacterium]